MVFNVAKRLSSIYQTILVCAFALSISACTVHLISDYNAKLVSQLQAIQKQINVILLSVQEDMGGPKARYSDYQNDYNQIQAELITLIDRNKAIPKSETTTKQLLILQKSITDLQKLHRLGFKTRQEVSIAQASINQDFFSIYQLQSLKKTYLSR